MSSRIESPPFAGWVNYAMFALLKREWRLIVFGVLLSFASAPGQTFFISLFSGELRDALGISHGQFGSYYSLGTLLSAAVMVWSGALIDRVDLRRFAAGIFIGLIVGCLMMSISSTGVALVLSIFLLRHFGQGLMFLTASTTVVRYIDADKGKANAISGMGYSLSEALMPKLVVLMLLLVGWQQSWRWIALGMVVVLPMALWLLTGHTARHTAYLEALDTDRRQFVRRQWRRSEVLRDSRFYLFVPNLMAPTLLFTGFIFHQVHLVASKGWSMSLWTTYFAVYAGVAIAMKVIAGFLVDRFSATALVPLHTAPLLLSLVLLSLSDAQWVALAFLVLLAISSGLQNTIATPFMSEQYGNQYLGSIKSATSAIMVFVSALSPWAMGWMIDQGITLERQAQMGAAYTAVTIALAAIGWRITKRRAAVL
ncbi:MAG: MFS transporter [Pseudomonadota bacterium]